MAEPHHVRCPVADDEVNCCRIRESLDQDLKRKRVRQDQEGPWTIRGTLAIRK